MSLLYTTKDRHRTWESAREPYESSGSFQNLEAPTLGTYGDEATPGKQGDATERSISFSRSTSQASWPKPAARRSSSAGLSRALEMQALGNEALQRLAARARRVSFI